MRPPHARPCASPRSAPRAAGPRRAGRSAATCGCKRCPPTLQLERCAQRPREPVERLCVDAHRRGQHGHVAGQRLQHRQPEALALGGHEHGVRGVHVQRHALRLHAAERQQPRSDGLGERLRAVVALLGAARVGGEQQVGAGAAGASWVRREVAEAGVCGSKDVRACARDIALKRSMSTPQGNTCARARARRPGSSWTSASDTAASRPTVGSAARVARRVRGWRTSVPCTVSARARAFTASAGHAVNPKWACTTSKRSLRVAPAQVACGARQGAARQARTRTARPATSLQAPAARPPDRARSGRARDGAASASMLDTTSARTSADGAPSPTCRDLWPAR